MSARRWWFALCADFSKVYVRSHSGAMVPLSALITVRYVAAPKLMERFNGFPAVKVTGNPAAGYSSGQALAAMEAVAAKALPGGFSYSWSGQALQEKSSGSTSSIAFVAGLIVVFLLLAAQFEKWTLPLAVLLTVPVAILGALLLTWIVGLENDVYFQVGLVTLVGLSAKNAILICEVAIEHVRQGMAIREAAVTAARMRLRAIVMTSRPLPVETEILSDATNKTHKSHNQHTRTSVSRRHGFGGRERWPNRPNLPDDFESYLPEIVIRASSSCPTSSADFRVWEISSRTSSPNRRRRRVTIIRKATAFIPHCAARSSYAWQGLVPVR